jgi:DNA mismatch repair protein MutS
MLDFDDLQVKDYFTIHNHYQKEFGSNSIVLMQVGSFHECYGTDMFGPNMEQLANKLEISFTMKNKSKPLSKSNPYMIGFPVYVTDNWVEKLLNFGYTVVVIDQVTLPPNPKRQLREIYSPSTIINNNNFKINDKNFLTVIYLEYQKSKISNFNKLIISLASYDISTGIGYYYETYSDEMDKMKVLDSVINYFNTYPSNEIVLIDHFDKSIKYNDLNFNQILEYLSLIKINTFDIKNINNYDKLSNQKLILNKVFGEKINEYIENSFIYNKIPMSFLLNYVEKHQPLLLNKITIPDIYDDQNKLFFGNNPLDQLEIISENGLINYLDHTLTPMGKRYFRSAILEPLVNYKKINKRLDDIEKLNDIFENNNLSVFETEMKQISDLFKLNRKVITKKIVPSEFYKIYLSFISIKNICSYYDSLNKHLKIINIIIEYIEKTFNLDVINNINFYNYNEEEKNIFKNNIYPNIDQLCSSVMSGNNFMENLCSVLEKYMDDKFQSKFSGKKNTIDIKKNERDGYYLLLTKRRSDILKTKLKKINELDINGQKISVSSLVFVNVSNKENSNVKITCNLMNNYSDNLNSNKNKLAKLTKECFYLEMEKFSEYYEKINNISNKIAYLDFIYNGYINKTKKGYFRPKIVKSENAYFRAKEIRHPLVELITGSKYIPQNIELGNDCCQNGILLYGINGSGKSTLMKSIGINIILAQIGYFVACKEFELSPYKSIFTRIKGNDNLFKGLSSFYVEMSELNAILKRNNSKTLVLADELCRGTEEKSANIIVSYMLEKLSENNASFITATHLHNLSQLESVKKLDRVKIKHISVEYKDNNLIFSRELKDGTGSKFYGVEVAKYLINDVNFNNRVSEIEKEYNSIVENEFEKKLSKYNKKLVMTKCSICESEKNLETHHILWQKDCNKHYVLDKPEIKKNGLNNLVVLCRKCHDEVDRNNIIINGYVDTINGKKLDYNPN